MICGVWAMTSVLASVDENACTMPNTEGEGEDDNEVNIGNHRCSCQRKMKSRVRRHLHRHLRRSDHE